MAGPASAAHSLPLALVPGELSHRGQVRVAQHWAALRLAGGRIAQRGGGRAALHLSVSLDPAACFLFFLFFLFLFFVAVVRLLRHNKMLHVVKATSCQDCPWKYRAPILVAAAG